MNFCVQQTHFGGPKRFTITKVVLYFMHVPFTDVRSCGKAAWRQNMYVMVIACFLTLIHMQIESD